MVFESLTFNLLLVILLIWEVIWKGLALWKAGRNNHLTWFILIFILNTAGILSIIYLLLNQNKKNKKQQRKIIKKRSN